MLVMIRSLNCLRGSFQVLSSRLNKQIVNDNIRVFSYKANGQKLQLFKFVRVLISSLELELVGK